MRVLLQRVTSASVRVDGVVVGRVGKGVLLLVGVTQSDSETEVAWMADKIIGLRVFSDSDGRMNLSLGDVDGGVLVVSQFTLYADTRKGRRPSYTAAAAPEHAEAVYELFLTRLRERGLRVEAGVFGAMMQVELVNDGPVTLWLEH